MTHRATPRFWRCYRQLPEKVRQLADESYRALVEDPRRPSLHFKKVGRFWSVRVGIHYRALALEYADNVVWFWIWPHAEYDRIIGG